MEFSFEYYNWLHKLCDEPGIMFAIASFGVLGVIFAFMFILWILKKIGLQKIASWTIWGDILAILFITLFIGFILLMLLMFVMDQDDSAGIRLFLIWLVLLLSVTVFYITQRPALSKWASELGTKKPKKKENK